MCTLSWCARPSGDGYHLLFNRDEQRDREPASRPEIVGGESRSFVTARDGRAGGTWLLANDRGLTVAILNHYGADTNAPAIERPESRGQLVMSLAECATTDEFRDRLGALAPRGRYRPFLIFAISPNLDASLWCWDGNDCRELSIPDPAILTTSSFKSEEVIAHRQRQREILPSPAQPDDLRELHRYHDPEKPAHSIRMRRSDAMTVALCEIEVTPDQACYRYQPESADNLELPPHEQVCLPIAQRLP